MYRCSLIGLLVETRPRSLRIPITYIHAGANLSGEMNVSHESDCTKATNTTSSALLSRKLFYGSLLFLGSKTTTAALQCGLECGDN